MMILALAVPGWLVAQEPASAGPRTESPLDALVGEAIQKNLSVVQATLADRQREAGVSEARGRLLPSVDLDARWSDVSGVLDLGKLVNPAFAALNQMAGANRFPTDLNITQPFRQDMRVRVTLPVVAPAAWAGVRASGQQREASRQRVGITAREIAAGVQLAYLQYAAAARSAELLRATLELLDENLRAAERLVAAGTSTPDAVSRARADRSETVQRLADTERRRDLAARALNQILQRPLTAPVGLIPDSLLPADVTLDVRTALQSAHERREELREAAAIERGAGAGVRVASAAFLPTVALAADLGYQGNRLRFTGDNDFAVLSVVVQWSLFRGGSDHARRQQAQLAEQQAATALREAEQQVELQVRQAVEAVEVARSEQVAAADRLAAARHTFELVRRRYEEGLAPHLEFTSARVAFTSAGLNEILTRYAHVARLVELERAAATRSIPSTR